MTDGADVLDQPVESVMSAPVERIDPAAPLSEAANRLSSANVGSLLVGATAGILTESDVVDHVSDGSPPERTRVRTAMSSPVVTIPAGATIRTAAERMHDREVKKLPVTEKGETVGVVTTTDVTVALAPDLDDIIEAVARE